MAEKKSGLGRGIEALIPSVNPSGTSERKSTRTGRPAGTDKATDVFFGGSSADANQSGGQTSSAQKGSAQTDSAAQTTLIRVPGAEFAELATASIRPNPRQPRSDFEPEAFQELVFSVKEVGVLQPIVVRRIAAGESAKTAGTKSGVAVAFELIMGERRLRAAKEAGLASIPAIIRDTGDENMLRDALLENLHRSNLNAIEEASAYQQLMEDFGITQEQLAERIGRSRPQISNMIRLLRLPISVQQKIAAGVLSAGHARTLLALDDHREIEALVARVIREGLSVRTLEELVGATKPKKGKAKLRQGSRQDALTELSSKLADRLNTSVSIKLTAKKGQLVIDFATVADLRRILAEMGIEQ